MRWARYVVDGRTTFGLVDADRVEDVRGSPFASYERSGVSRPLSEVALLVPVIPRTFYAAGLNYAEHVWEQTIEFPTNDMLFSIAHPGQRTHRVHAADQRQYAGAVSARECPGIRQSGRHSRGQRI